MYVVIVFALLLIVNFTKISFCMAIIPNNAAIRPANPKQLDKIVYHACKVAVTILKQNFDIIHTI